MKTVVSEKIEDPNNTEDQHPAQQQGILGVVVLASDGALALAS